MKKNPKIALKGGAELDALTKSRRWYSYLTKSTVAKKLKRQYNKRFRRIAKKEIRDE